MGTFLSIWEPIYIPGGASPNDFKKSLPGVSSKKGFTPSKAAKWYSHKNFGENPLCGPPAKMHRSNL